ncbi:hypothetical protein X741_21565 [Mesorhizobium sp. LNHC229A00]|nr:hypothetical protein X741_21565 [Mesorhizobium sp. LNHC229A00]
MLVLIKLIARPLPGIHNRLALKARQQRRARSGSHPLLMICGHDPGDRTPVTGHHVALSFADAAQ